MPRQKLQKPATNVRYSSYCSTNYKKATKPTTNNNLGRSRSWSINLTQVMLTSTICLSIVCSVISLMLVFVPHILTPTNIAQADSISSKSSSKTIKVKMITDFNSPCVSCSKK